MRLLVLFILCLVYYVFCITEIEDLTNPQLLSVPVNFDDADAVKTNVNIKLFIKVEEIKGRMLDEVAIEKLVLNRNLPAKFFIHGFRSSSNDTWYGALKAAYFRRGPYNIFYVNWSKAANKFYNVSAANVKPVGEIVGDYIIASRIPLQFVHIISDGLGCMVAGFVGKRVSEKTKKKIFRITAADPASAKFEHIDVSKRMRLSEGDAMFLDVIHTDMGHYGFTEAMGHADFFPNGGSLQIGCPSVETDPNCNHRKAMEYYIVSVNYPKHFGQKCDSWKVYLKNLCVKNPVVLFGEHTNTFSKGNYYYWTVPQVIKKKKLW